MKDYPFYTWEDYYAALTEYLCNSDYNELYPKYLDYISEYGFIKDIDIINELLDDTNLSPQDGLDGFLKTLIDSGNTNIPIRQVIDLFLQKGANINPDILFERVFITSNMGNFRDEIYCGAYETRGILIDILAEYNIDFSIYADWSYINAMYWEDIPNYNKFNYKEACLMALKYYSNHLQTEY